MLSIIIPTREEEKAICTTITRLKKGLTLPHEIIVSDAGSKDKTVEVAQGCADKVVVLENGQKPTPSRERNDGAKVAAGEFLVFMDADCGVVDSDTFFKGVQKHFDEDETLVGLTVPQYAWPEVETFMDKIGFGILNILVRFQNNVLHHGEANGKFMMVRRKAFEFIKGFDETLVTREDADLFVRLAKIGKTRFDPHRAVFHGARRAHKIGWPRLWWIWILNTIYVSLFHKSFSEDWAPVR